MGRTIVFAHVVLSLFIVAARADAERAAIVPLGGDPGIAEPVRREALTKLSELLRGQGLEVMPPAETTRRVSPVRCQGRECEQALRAALRVDLLVTMGLWSTAGTNGVVRGVVVGLVRQASYYGTADVGSAGISGALEEAIAMARSREAVGPGPWLRVEGEPRGALVVVDGTDWGVLPKEAPIEAGPHRVVVRLDGYEAVERTVTVPPDATDPVVVTVRLTRAGGQDPAAGARPDEPSLPRHPLVTRIERPIAGPLAVGVLGIGLVTVDLLTLAMTGCEREAAGSSCQELNSVPFALYGVGGLVAVASALFWHLAFGETQSVAPAADHPASAIGISQGVSRE